MFVKSESKIKAYLLANNIQKNKKSEAFIMSSQLNQFFRIFYIIDNNKKCLNMT